jgi:hypothetical protein
MKRIFSALILLLLLGSSALAAGSYVRWTSEQVRRTQGVVTIYTATVLSDDAAGTASGAIAMHGYIVKAVTNPGAAAPDDNYDCVLNDADGADAMGGALANRHTTTTQQVLPLLLAGVPGRIRVDGSMTLSCSAMGNAKATVARFTVEE